MEMVEVFWFKVRLVAVDTSQMVPVPDNVQVPLPMVKVLVLLLEEEKEPAMFTVLLLASRDPGGGGGGW